MPVAATGIADQKAFPHVPGMGKEAPFRRHNGQAFAASGFAGERRDDPGDRYDAGGDVLEELASCFHKIFSGEPPSSSNQVSHFHHDGVSATHSYFSLAGGRGS